MGLFYTETDSVFSTVYEKIYSETIINDFSK